MKSVMEYDAWLAAPLVKEFEGLRLQSYICPAGVWTIGYGHTRGVKPGQKITEAQAEDLLRKDLDRYQIELANLVHVPVTQGQFIALMSWFYNLGNTRAVRDSTLLKLLNSGDYMGAANQFPRWNKSGKVVIDGLTRRREAERKMFLS